MSTMQLARAEMTQKGKRYGTGDGLFAAAGVLGLFAVQALLATCIATIAVVLPVWAAALAISGVLAAVAAATALVGTRQITQVGAPIPEQTLASVKADLAEVKERAHR
ncbi:phage holin family protein [Streptomyces sp. NPDC059957]|uniref:phage holin family protein n=1 Tax=unclassified Streptomyces TaxID=2593676 RepID=UPI00365371B2